MQEEAERAEAQREASMATQGQPFRFFTGVGETKEIIIVDEAPDFVRNEHAIQNHRTKRWDTFVPCIDEHANCPVCESSDRPSYFALYLTVIDLSGYENSLGDWVEFSKKLLVVKPMQQKKIMRLYQRHGSLRGMRLEMSRDSKKEAAIGDPEFIDFVEEDELLTYETEYVDKDDKVHEVICHEPFDYDAIFPAMDEDQLRALVGGKPSTGHRRTDDRALGRGRGRTQEDDWEDTDQPQRRVASRRSARTEEPEEAEQPTTRRGRAARTAEPEEAPARPARTARTAAPATSRRSRTIDPEDNPETGATPWEGEEERPARRSAGTRRTAPEPEEAVRRPANVASRRAALRRG